ncbi:MAG: peptidase domain-containing ABC transporter [Holophagales bacterium]|nr:peptidase domain-containing ABC transporter [Holophagales bacterium]
MPWIPQTADADCGPACLAMVLAYHGKEIPLDEARSQVFSGRDGATARLLLDTAADYGLRGRGVTVHDVDDLRHLPKGSILHWNFKHFVVLESPERSGARIVDPESGRRWVSKRELRRRFTGVALAFEPTADFEPERRGQAGGTGRYVRELLAHSSNLRQILLISVVLQLLALALPIATGLVVDRVVPHHDTSLLLVLALGMLALLAFRGISSLVRAFLLLQLRTELDAKITLEFLDHLVDLPYAFFQNRSSGDLMMRLASNATVREILTGAALSALLDGALVTLYLAMLWWMSPAMGLLVLILGASRVAVFLVSRRRHQELMSESLVAQAHSRSFQVQMLGGIETLKAAGAEKRAVEQWSDLFVDELNVAVDQGRLRAFYDTALDLLASASPLVVLLFGTHQVLAGELSLGTMLALSALAAGFLGPLSSLVSTALDLVMLESYVARIDDVLRTEKEQEAGVGRVRTKLAGRIALEGVCFRYGPDSPMVIHDVSLEIEAGSLVALVGPSGAGKTTLAHLLMGLYRPTAGRVLLDGRDLDTLDLRAVRRQIGVVTQNPYLFGPSIRQCISLADPSLGLDRVIEAAKLACIHDEIEAMPLAYETLLGEGGSTLSGGQCQRLALARALATRPALLLLDEATSSLDAAREREIHHQLDRYEGTRIVIAHRLSTVRSADRIVVVSDGRIAENGTYGELIEAGGTFSDLVEAQLTPVPAPRMAAG